MKLISNDSKIYSVEFEQLIEEEKIPTDSANQIFEALMDITVSMGSAKEKIGKVVDYKVGDIIVLDKHLEETLDINVNGRMIASGESIIIDNKLGVRLSQIKADSQEI